MNSGRTLLAAVVVLAGCAASVSPVDGTGPSRDAGPAREGGATSCADAPMLTEGVAVTLNACDGDALATCDGIPGSICPEGSFGRAALMRFPIVHGRQYTLDVHTTESGTILERHWLGACDTLTCAHVAGSGCAAPTQDLMPAFVAVGTTASTAWYAIGSPPGEPCRTYVITLSSSNP